MNVVLDSNVLVSALLSPSGKCASILRLVLSGKLIVCLDVRIFLEYQQVLLRDKFRFTEEHVHELLEYIWSSGVVLSPDPLRTTLPDPFDQPFLEAAVEGKVDYLITGNRAHYSGAESFGVQVVSPADFLEHFQHPSSDD